MQITTRAKVMSIGTLTLGLALLGFLAGPRAVAQIPVDAGRLCLFQERVQVGELYTDRSREDTTYVEHWVLYDNYIGVGETGRRSLEVEVCEQRYDSVKDFLANVAWGPGYRYVHVTAHESTELPQVKRAGGQRRGR